MARRPEARGEKLSGDDERGAVGTEVGEEEGERVHNKEPSCVMMQPVVVRNCKREHEDRHEEESLQLDFEPADAVDECHCDPIAGHRRAKRDERLRPRNFERLLYRGHVLGWWQPTHGGVDVLLEEVLAIKCYVK